MFKRKAVTFLAVAFAILSLAFRATAQEKTRIETKRLTGEELYRMQLEQARAEATPIEVKDIGKHQNDHNKLYKDYKTGRKILDDVRSAKSEMIGLGRPAGTPSIESLDINELFKEMAIKADVILIGTVKKMTSQLTEDEDFIYTDYQINIDHVYEDNPSDSIWKHGMITVTRPGGTVLIEGHIVQAIDEAFLPLHKGMQYLLFLQYIPSTGAYQPLDFRSSFLLINNQAFKLTKGYFPIEDYFKIGNRAGKTDEVNQGIDARVLLDSINSAASTVSGNRHGGMR